MITLLPLLHKQKKLKITAYFSYVLLMTRYTFFQQFQTEIRLNRMGTIFVQHLFKCNLFRQLKLKKCRVGSNCIPFICPLKKPTQRGFYLTPLFSCYPNSKVNSGAKFLTHLSLYIHIKGLATLAFLVSYYFSQLVYRGSRRYFKMCSCWSNLMFILLSRTLNIWKLIELQNCVKEKQCRKIEFQIK